MWSLWSQLTKMYFILTFINIFCIIVCSFIQGFIWITFRSCASVIITTSPSGRLFLGNSEEWCHYSRRVIYYNVYILHNMLKNASVLYLLTSVGMCCITQVIEGVVIELYLCLCGRRIRCIVEQKTHVLCISYLTIDNGWLCVYFSLRSVCM